MKTKKTGSLPTQPIGMGMGGQSMMRPPMTRPSIPATPMRRPQVMKSRGMPLAGFAPAPKKARRGKKGNVGKKMSLPW